MSNENGDENKEPHVACSRYFGYLSQLSQGKKTPDKCLICKQLIDCRLSKCDSKIPKIASETLVIEEVKPSVQEPFVEAEKTSFDEATQTENVTKPSRVDLPGEQFAVENLGVLYSKWSGTVLINKEILASWGAKINEVDIQTEYGKKMRCKIMASEDPRKGIVLMPEKVQLTLGLKQGDRVSVDPIVLLELENKSRDIAQAFYSLKRIGLRSVRKYKKMTQIWRSS